MIDMPVIIIDDGLHAARVQLADHMGNPDGPVGLDEAHISPFTIALTVCSKMVKSSRGE